MKSLHEKDLKRRLNYGNRELSYIVLKSLTNNALLNKKKRFRFYKRIGSLVRYAERTKIVNRCVISNRSRGVYSDFKLSRIKIRELAHRGDLPGVNKSSW